MARRRTTVQSELTEKYVKMTWEEATEQFLDGMKVRGLSYHTRRWHKENLQAVAKQLRLAGHPTEARFGDGNHAPGSGPEDDGQRPFPDHD